MVCSTYEDKRVDLGGDRSREQGQGGTESLAYHANIIAVKEDFRKFGLSPCVVAIKIDSQKTIHNHGYKAASKRHGQRKEDT
jgi:hypothetical protein